MRALKITLARRPFLDDDDDYAEFYDDDDYDGQKDGVTLMIKEFSKASLENKKISDIDWKLISKREKTLEIFESCKRELEKMSSTRFYGNRTYVQVLKMSKSFDKLANLTKNDEYVKKFRASLKLFDYYKDDLEMVLKRAIELRNESLEVYKIIETIFHELLPEVVLRNLSGHLGIKDLPMKK